jgi:hypothetical protein
MLYAENTESKMEEPAEDSLDSLLHSLINVNQVMLIETELLIDSVRSGTITQKELKNILLRNFANVKRTRDLLHESKKALRNLSV